MTDLEHPPEQLTEQQVVEEANHMREILQERTCCPEHALAAAMICAATFALDGQEPEVAAQALENAASLLARDIRCGNFKLERKFQS